eukprot:CFRG5884T1
MKRAAIVFQSTLDELSSEDEDAWFYAGRRWRRQGHQGQKHFINKTKCMKCQKPEHTSTHCRGKLTYLIAEEKNGATHLTKKDTSVLELMKVSSASMILGMIQEQFVTTSKSALVNP